MLRSYAIRDLERSSFFRFFPTSGDHSTFQTKRAFQVIGAVGVQVSGLALLSFVQDAVNLFHAVDAIFDHLVDVKARDFR